MTREDVYCTVRDVVLSMRDGRARAVADVGPHTSLMDIIVLDSLVFVDLTVALEDALQIDSFPMQDWADQQSDLEGARYTLGALAEACAAQLT